MIRPIFLSRSSKNVENFGKLVKVRRSGKKSAAAKEFSSDTANWPDIDSFQTVICVLLLKHLHLYCTDEHQTWALDICTIWLQLDALVPDLASQMLLPDQNHRVLRLPGCQLVSCPVWDRGGGQSFCANIPSLWESLSETLSYVMEWSWCYYRVSDLQTCQLMDDISFLPARSVSIKSKTSEIFDFCPKTSTSSIIFSCFSSCNSLISLNAVLLIPSRASLLSPSLRKVIKCLMNVQIPWSSWWLQFGHAGQADLLLCKL